jgi:hypothetical protein
MFQKCFALMCILVLAVVAVQCGKKGNPAEEAYIAIQEKMESDTLTPQEKATLARDFLGKFPESKYTGEILGNAVYCLSDKLKDTEGAYQLVVSVIGRLQDPEILKDVKFQFIQLLGKMGKSDELKRVIGELTGQGPLGYDDCQLIAGAAAEGKVFDLALENADKALAFATPEAFKVDNPQQEFTQDRIDRMVRRRKAEALAAKGWALCNLGRASEGRSVYEEAKGVTYFNCIGIPETQLNRYIARTDLAEGRNDDAIEALIPEAVFWSEKDAVELLKQAYTAKNGKADGFEDYVRAVRTERARPVEDFTLPDYKSENFTFSSLREGKVALLSFWFPT